MWQRVNIKISISEHFGSTDIFRGYIRLQISGGFGRYLLAKDESYIVDHLEPVLLV